MSYQLRNDEDKRRRRTARVREGVRYWRSYDVSPQAPSLLISEGDPMPGETAALLGPFVEAGGIAYGQQGGGAKQSLQLRCVELAPRTPGATGDYIELVGRSPGDSPDADTILTIGVAFSETAAGVPHRGDSLTGTSPPAYCVAVRKDYDRFPQRVAFIASWRSQRGA